MGKITQISVSKNGQYLITMPRAIAEGLGFHDAVSIEWTILDKDRIQIKKISREQVEVI